jgi:hypothetical protein
MCPKWAVVREAIKNGGLRKQSEATKIKINPIFIWQLARAIYLGSKTTTACFFFVGENISKQQW